MKEDLATVLTEAISRLEEAKMAFAKGDEKKAYDRVWKTGSDVEYATFIMALSRKGGDDGWKKQWRSKREVNIEATLHSVQDLLKEAVKALISDREEAYRKAWLARGYILDIQNKLDRGL